MLGAHVPFGPLSMLACCRGGPIRSDAGEGTTLPGSSVVETARTTQAVSADVGKISPANGSAGWGQMTQRAVDFRAARSTPR